MCTHHLCSGGLLGTDTAVCWGYSSELSHPILKSLCGVSASKEDVQVASTSGHTVGWGRLPRETDISAEKLPRKKWVLGNMVGSRMPGAFPDLALRRPPC